jgi:hypothetical protein
MSQEAARIRTQLEKAISAALPISGIRVRAALEHVVAELAAVDRNNAPFRTHPEHCGTCGDNGYVPDLTGETGTAACPECSPPSHAPYPSAADAHTDEAETAKEAIRYFRRTTPSEDPT